MMDHRWRSTRARLSEVTPAAEATGLWDRIAASRRAGTSVDLPARDAQGVGPALLFALLLVAIAGATTLNHRSIPAPADSVATAAVDSTESHIYELFATPAYAQAGASALLPIDPPDLSRLTPRRLVYRHEEGVDGVRIAPDGTDTLTISRDGVADAARIALVRTGTRGAAKYQYALVDSLLLSGEGSLLLWRYHGWVGSTGRGPFFETTFIADSVHVESLRGRMKHRGFTYPANIGEYVLSPLIAMLPSLPFREGYARSVSGLDLLGGTPSPGFVRSLELRVTGTQSIKVPAGRFHCWTVELTAIYLPGDLPRVTQLWVDTATGSLVRAVWAQANGFYQEQLLVEQQVPRGSR